MRKLAAAALILLSSCAPDQPVETPTRAMGLAQGLPPMRAFAAGPVTAPARSNSDIARDFLDLSFEMENGDAIPALTRFDGPITVRVRGRATASLDLDLDLLLARLRNEAGLPITRTRAENANITVEAIPQKTLQRAVPGAACFVVPRVDSWQEYLKARGSDALNWTTLQTREKTTIFVPADAAPQEVRDCLHEELAQALGPLNDLYRLPDSVFNDDNIHAVLTGFDMLILRAYYAPALANGMTRDEVTARLPAILKTLNPGGERRAALFEPGTTRDWISAMEVALATGPDAIRRRAAAEQAISLTRQFGLSGPREGFAYYAYGRLQVGNDPARALDAFKAADAVYRSDPQMTIHTAHIAVQKSAFALAAGDAQETLALAEASIPVAEAHQNAALLATLMMFKAEALDMVGNSVAADRVRLDSLAWARYGFGSEQNVAARLSEISALRPF